MFTETSFPLDSQEAPVPHVFYRQEAITETLGLLLPGYNYTVDMPLLYYPRSLLLQNIGADVLQIDYAYNRIPGFIDRPVQDRYARLAADVTGPLEAALAQRSYRRIVLAGKSLGTAAMGLLLPRLAKMPGVDVRCLWLTPLLTDPNLSKVIRAFPRAGLFVTGTADRYYHAGTLEELCVATDGKAVVIEGADHSLHVDGSLEGTLKALTQVMAGVEEFLSSPAASG
jgi:hypothetical protein